MSNMFLTSSFKNNIDSTTGLVLPEYIQTMTAIKDRFQTLGLYAVTCYAQDTGWDLPATYNNVVQKRDVKAFKDHDLFVALLPGKTVPPSLRFQIIYALHNEIPVITAAAPDSLLGDWHMSFPETKNVTHVPYTDTESLFVAVTSVDQK